MSPANFPICIYTAWTRVSAEYRNLKLGYLWETLSLVFTVCFLVLVWRRVLESSSAWDYFFYVLLGFSAWNLMSGCINQCISFKKRTYAEMRRGSTTLSNQFFIDVTYCFIQFLLTFPLILIVCFLFFGFSFVHIVTVVLSLLCIFVTAYALFSSLALLTIIYEDVSRLVRTIMRVAFLMTPVLWHPDMLGDDVKNLVYLNPFYCYLDVFRTGLMLKPISALSLTIMLSLTTALHFIGLVVFKGLEGKVLSDIFLEKNAK